MAGGQSTYYANLLLNKGYRGVDFTPPTVLYMALTTAPDEVAMRNNSIATADEVANAGAYARQTVLVSNISAPTGGLIAITVDTFFPAAAAPWGTVRYGMLMDSPTYGAGNIICFGPLSATALVQTGDTIMIPAGTFAVRL